MSNLGYLGYVSEAEAREAYRYADLAKTNVQSLIRNYPSAALNIGAQAAYDGIVGWYDKNKTEFETTTHMLDAGYRDAANTAKDQFNQLADKLVQEAYKTGEAVPVGGGQSEEDKDGDGKPDKPTGPLGASWTTWIIAGLAGAVVIMALRRSERR